MKSIFSPGATMVAAALLAVTACGGGSADAADVPAVATDTVYLRNIEFQPAHIVVEQGTTVEWIWDDGSIEHDVSADSFESEVKESGTFTHTFEGSGDFPYVCTLHRNMTGVVTVTDRP